MAAAPGILTGVLAACAHLPLPEMAVSKMLCLEPAAPIPAVAVGRSGRCGRALMPCNRNFRWSQLFLVPNWMLS